MCMNTNPYSRILVLTLTHNPWSSMGLAIAPAGPMAGPGDRELRPAPDLREWGRKRRRSPRPEIGPRPVASRKVLLLLVWQHAAAESFLQLIHEVMPTAN